MKQITLKSLFEFDPSTDPSNLIGARFLCKNGTLLIVGASGIGKSTFSLQMCCKFALGLDFLGIRPDRALKTIYIQAENDFGDMAEIFQGLCKSLDIRPKSPESKLLHQNIKIFSEDQHSGDDFLGSLETVVKQEKPDIILIDPLLSYIGGDISQQEVVGKFLRDGLNPILRTSGAACIMVHHIKKGGGSDLYAAMGSVELANSPRAIINLSPAKANPGCDLILEATKRGDRIGLKNVIGESTNRLGIRYGKTGAPSFEVVETVSFEPSSGAGGVAARHARVKGYIDRKMKKSDAIAKIAETESISPKTAGRDYNKLFGS